MTKKRKSSAFNIAGALKSMAKINTTNISHDKAIKVLKKGMVASKHRDLGIQMDTKLFNKLAPSGGRTRSAPATIATAARAVFVDTMKKSRYEEPIKRAGMRLWVKELHKMYPQVPHFQDQDELNLLCAWNHTLYAFN